MSMAQIVAFEMTVPVVLPVCDDVGRATALYPSAEVRQQVGQVRLLRGEQRCLCIDWRALIAPARTIAQVTWRVMLPYVATLSGGSIGGTQTCIMLRANYLGQVPLKAIVQTDNGEQYVYLIVADVLDSPWFVQDTIADSGVTQIVVTA